MEWQEGENEDEVEEYEGREMEEWSKNMKPRIIGSIMEEREKLCVGPIEGL